MIVTDFRLVIKGAAFYEDKYFAKATASGGSRTPATCGSTSTTQSFDDLPSWKLTANRWAS